MHPSLIGVIAAQAGIPPGITATGGTITTYSGYKAHTFTGLGTFTIASNSDGRTIDVFVLGGGGATPVVYGRSGSATGAQGGGGSGGFRVFTGVSGAAGATTITIGAGGAAGENEGVASNFGTGTTYRSGGGNHGPPTTAGAMSQSDGGGGGGGAFYNLTNGTPSASGTYGYDGGTGYYIDFASLGGGAGGGGAGGVGQQVHQAGIGADNNYRTGVNERRGEGGCGGSCYTNGSGPESQATGAAGGGTGGAANTSTNNQATNGTANTGGGAGGNSWGTGSQQPGMNGGSGLVIIRYSTS